MLARTKAADKHVAHYTWVGHDSGRLHAGGLPEKCSGSGHV